MGQTAMQNLLALTRDVHLHHRAVRDFVQFPDDLRDAHVAPCNMPAADYLHHEPWGDDPEWGNLTRAFMDASNEAYWRDTYAGTAIDPDFMNRFGCYCLIGKANAPWESDKMAGYVVYMPASLHYPWHQHPAEELYLVIAGQAEFHIKDQPTKTLKAGDTSLHETNVPHAMTTGDSGVMAYVIWRGDLKTKPIWTEQDLRKE